MSSCCRCGGCWSRMEDSPSAVTHFCASVVSGMDKRATTELSVALQRCQTHAYPASLTHPHAPLHELTWPGLAQVGRDRTAEYEAGPRFLCAARGRSCRGDKARREWRRWLVAASDGGSCTAAACRAPICCPHPRCRQPATPADCDTYTKPG